MRDRYPDLPALLTAIRERPGLFLGRPTITGLELFLVGIRFAEDFHRLPLGERMGGFDREGFERWVEAGNNPEQLSLNSFSLAARLAGSEAAGFDLWFGWYEAFLGGRFGQPGSA